MTKRVDARGLSCPQPVIVSRNAMKKLGQGAIEVPAKVTNRIMEGVVRCYQGAWYAPGEDGIDKGGNVNVLLDDQLNSASGASNCNTCLVDVRVAKSSIRSP